MVMRGHQGSTSPQIRPTLEDVLAEGGLRVLYPLLGPRFGWIPVGARKPWLESRQRV